MQKRNNLTQIILVQKRCNFNLMLRNKVLHNKKENNRGFGSSSRSKRKQIDK